ncbi:MAG: hypothetical protein MZU97_01855 [Bacillus subtilis]|nr:hypothetical protein [Bacillus subtilis]
MELDQKMNNIEGQLLESGKKIEQLTYLLKDFVERKNGSSSVDSLKKN